MNVVFLDIDGVLVSWLKMNDRDENHVVKFEPNAILSLNKITSLLNAKIVITSTWRKTRTLEIFSKLFKERGIEAEVIGMTDELDTGRASEIQSWIDSNPVNYFIIIDDNTRGIEEFFKDDKNILKTGLFRGLDEYDFLYAKRSYENFNKKKK